MASKKPSTSYTMKKSSETTQVKYQSTIKNQTKKPNPIGLSTNLEAFACLWLDADIANTEDNRETEQKLRQFINHLRTFHNAKLCEEVIRKINKEKVVLIVSGQFGREIIPRIHDLSQLIACYIYCFNESEHQEWSKEYSKIQGVFVDQTIFLTKFNEDQKARLKAEELAAINIVSDDLTANESRHAIFLWFQLYIEVLIRMHHHSNVKQDFIAICKENYKENKEELKIIDDFEKTYRPDQAIKWYTRECCFYRILNKALRVQDFDMLFALRFFITDISKQLKQIHRSNLRTMPIRDIIRVYRGQAIGKDELNVMQASVGKYLSMNSFLSTSLQLPIAVNFLNNAQITDGMERILYEISINPSEKTKAYGEINKLSFYNNEDEILIMLGALFRIDEIEKNDKLNIWIGHLTLVSDDNDQLKETFTFMKQKIEQETNLASLGQILIEMGEYNQALKYSQKIMHEAKLNEAKALEIKAKAAALKGDYRTAFDCSQQIMAIFDQIFPPVCQEKGQLLSSIGALHCQQGTFRDALSFLKKALEIQQKILPVNHADLCETYQHFGDCYEGLNNVDSAFDYYNKCLEIRRRTVPENHPAMASIYNDLGVVFEKKGNFSEALEYYQKSLGISRKILPPTHPEVRRTMTNIEQLESELEDQ